MPDDLYAAEAAVAQRVAGHDGREQHAVYDGEQGDGVEGGDALQPLCVEVNQDDGQRAQRNEAQRRQQVGVAPQQRAAEQIDGVEEQEQYERSLETTENAGA